MNARTKLNTSYFFGGLLFASLAGWITGSVLVFALTAAVLVAGSCYSGEIRLLDSSKSRGSNQTRR